MATLIKLWVISVFVWPLLLGTFLFFKNSFASYTSQAIKSFLSNLGWAFISSGGIGIIIGIAGDTYDKGVGVMAFVALMFTIFGLILVMSNMEKK